MAFFNVDDQFHGHPKARAAGLAAVGLWTVAGSWCKAYKSEGLVPEWLVTDWRAKKAADQLVLAGLWTRTDQGYQFHDWGHLNDPADEIERQRELGRKRQRDRRKKLREERGVDL